jgi:hypothetical protein
VTAKLSALLDLTSSAPREIRTERTRHSVMIARLNSLDDWFVETRNAEDVGGLEVLISLVYAATMPIILATKMSRLTKSIAFLFVVDA